MKKKLSLLLAIVFVLTLAFGVLPGPKAEATQSTEEPPDGIECFTYVDKPNGSNFTSGSFAGGNILVIKQANAVLVWKDSSLSGLDDSIIKAAVKYLVDENSIDHPFYFTTSTDFNMMTVMSTDDQQYNIDIDIDPLNHTFTTSKSISHYYIFNYQCNQPEYGSLKVEKIATGNNKPSGVEFSVTVVFTAGPDGNLDDITSTPAFSPVNTSTSTYTYTFTLTDGNNVTFNNVPVGTTYDVTETLTTAQTEAGWSNTSIVFDDSQAPLKTIDFEDDDDKVTVNNNYTKVEFGSLEIKKDVESYNAPTGVSFPVTVKFTLGSSGSLSTITLDGSPITLSASNEYTFTLVDNGSIKFENIPAGTTYAITEGALLPGWYNDNEPGDNLNGTISKNYPRKVTVENRYTTPKYGKLVVEKKISGQSDSYYADQLFTIQVTFTNGNTVLDGILYPNDSVTPLGNNKYQVTIKGSQTAPYPSVTFSNIPVGTTYEVEEVSVPTGWTPTYFYDDNGATPQTIDPPEKINHQWVDDTDTATVTNTFTQEYGSLSVKKEVQNDETYLSHKFEITVVFTKVGATGSLEDIMTDSERAGDIVGTPVITNTTATFVLSLSHNDDPFIFTNIPVGFTYMVTETALTDWNVDYDFSNESTAKAITKDTTDYVTVENTYAPPPPTGSLKVEKQVINSNTTDTFDIEVTFTNESGLEGLSASPEAQYSNNEGDTERTYTISLGDNGNVMFSGIPQGTTYTVVETEELPSTWTVTYDSSETNTVKVINTYTPPTPPPPPPPGPEFGSLTVDKTVSGAGASTTEPFTFTVTFPETVSGIVAPAGITGANGVYTFTLSAAATPVVFSNIPAGTAYTVTETIAGTQTGWTAGAVTGNTGNISTAGSTAIFDNVFTATGVAGEQTDDEQGVAGDSDEDLLPQTGGISSSTLLGFFGLTLIAAGGTTFVLFRKKNDDKSK